MSHETLSGKAIQNADQLKERLGERIMQEEKSSSYELARQLREARTALRYFAQSLAPDTAAFMKEAQMNLDMAASEIEVQSEQLA